MIRTVITSAIVLCAMACSIAKPHPDAVDTLKATRLVGGVTVENQSRWTLPPFAQVSVAHADGRTDNERLLAAQTGLSQFLQIAPATSIWRIDVHWPDLAFDGAGEQPADPHWAKQVWRGTKQHLTRTADRSVLMVDVIHAADNHLVTRLEVDIQPWLRGRDWHDPVALTRAFSAVGAVLTGS